MFGIFTRFRKISIRRFQHGVLIAMAQLSLHGCVPGLVFFFLLQRTFETILVFAIDMGHR